eukprot:TRINITY_DN1241_c0_g1_i8.p1 TRINITY_DN1241_c0_g1~~TRINITY_DN1241_c0_g1_i8.p1  ORF type:complete len:335 (+),score=91.02 TRINITY_DN1241_c0_g1_i8:306-1310(+)
MVGQPWQTGSLTNDSKATVSVLYWTLLKMADREISIVHEMGSRIKADKLDIGAYGEQGQAYFRMGEYQAADDVFSSAIKEAEEAVKMLKRWKRKCETHLTTSNVVVKEERKAEQEAQVAAQPPVEKADTASTSTSTVPNVRVDWFQTQTSVTVNLFIHSSQQIKGSTSHAEVDISENGASAKVTLKSGDTFTWSAQPLFSSIDVATSSYSVKHMKVEIVLAKKMQGLQWDALVGEKKPFPEAPGAYPTSNTKQKDWTKYTVVDEEEEVKPEGNDALNKLFRDIYSKGDQATQMAMNKSFQESNGTVLSTNWKEVGEKKVVGQPPAGMEEKKWNE